MVDLAEQLSRCNILGARDESVKKEVARTLLKAQVCTRCCLRFLGARPGLLVQPVKYQHLADWCSAPDARSEAPFVCSVCFGILQLDTGSSFKDILLRVARTTVRKGEIKPREIRIGCTYDSQFYRRLMSETVGAMEGDGFDCAGTNFTLTLTVPAAMVLRDLALAYWLSRKFEKENLTFSHMVDLDLHKIKRVCKLIFTNTLGEALQSKFLMDQDEESGDLGLDLNLGSPELGDAENDFHRKIADLCKKDGSKKRKRDKFHATFIDSSPVAMSKAAQKMDDADFLSLAVHPEREGWLVSAPGHLSMHYHRHPIYVAGRYVKKSRELSQTAWIVESDKRVTPTSVEEVIRDRFQSMAEADEWKMVAAGREDADVRMLGKGRPFVMEIKNAMVKRIPGLQPQYEMDLVGLRDLCQTTRESLVLLQEGAEEKSKTYSAQIWASRALTAEDFARINAMPEFLIKQKTPLRVFHRRAGLIRDRRIYHLKLLGEAGQNTATLELKTQAGTYIKEFVHGDFGRTEPCLGTLLGSCFADITSLDVLDIEMDFAPPPIM